MESETNLDDRPRGSLLIDGLRSRDVSNLLRAETGRPGDLIETEADLRRAWEENRGHLMQIQSDAFPFGHPPGKRPQCWWRFEAPEGRWIDRYDVIETQPDGRYLETVHEPELEYLYRHGFLTIEELAIFEGHEFQW